MSATLAENVEVIEDPTNATVQDVFEELLRRRLISRREMNRYSLGFGGWRGSLRLPRTAKLYDIGVRCNSTLHLRWTVRGLGRESNSSTLHFAS